MRTLVAYASAHGSTRRIAEHVGARLSDHGWKADVREMAGDPDPAGYDAVVLGSAIHGQAWLPVAVDFVRRREAALVNRPLWLFSVGMPGAMRGPLRRLVAGEGAKVVSGLPPSVRSGEHPVFDGAIHPSHLPPLGRVLLRLIGGRYGDFVNWTRIDEWVDQVSRQLRETTP